MIPIARRAGCLVASFLLLVALGRVVSGDPTPTKAELTTDQAAALDRITANSLRGHLSFLASDLLEGRDTPSRGLDLAAEYIAAQFRRAGLEVIGDDGYFQTATWKVPEADADSFTFDLKVGDDPPIHLGKERISAQRTGAFDVEAARVSKVDARNSQVVLGLTPAQVEGKAVFAEVPGVGSTDRAERVAFNTFLSRMTVLKAAIIVNVSRQAGAASGFAPGRAFDPETRRPGARPGGERPGPPMITVHDPKVLAFFESLPPGVSDKAVVSSHLGEPVTKTVKVRNVAGLLRGSDPALKDTYVLVTAHYDHVGVQGAAGDTGDRIFNGANDDGSGTVSVVELASSLVTLKTPPKRSILFMTFFGEEKGLLGSRYYGRHPLVPIERTVADVNLEQVGRTDDSEGPRVGAAVMTGHGSIPACQSLQ